MPDEFAAAYRAAYEEALRAQAAPDGRGRVRPRRGGHARVVEPDPGPPDELPERDRRSAIRIGTHRMQQVDAESSAYERMRDSVWFVPALVLFLVLLLLLGAYVVGRQFSAHVGGTSQSTIALDPGSD